MVPDYFATQEKAEGKNIYKEKGRKENECINDNMATQETNRFFELFKLWGEDTTQVEAANTAKD